MCVNTVTKLLVDAGEACQKFHDEAVRDVPSSRIEVDEIWAFCYAKARTVPHAVSAPEGAGDAWDLDWYRPGLQAHPLLGR